MQNDNLDINDVRLIHDLLISMGSIIGGSINTQVVSIKNANIKQLLNELDFINSLPHNAKLYLTIISIVTNMANTDSLGALAMVLLENFPKYNTGPIPSNYYSDMPPEDWPRDFTID